MAAVFGDAAFQTPKLESSFYDPRITWDTADPYASNPEFLRTPQRYHHLGPATIDPKAQAQAQAQYVAAMQTPPPSSASMRKPLDQVQSASRRLSTHQQHLPPPPPPPPPPETPSRLMRSSPRMMSQLHSSPDPFQLSSSANSPMSSFFPQPQHQRLFLDSHGVSFSSPFDSDSAVTAYSMAHVPPPPLNPFSHFAIAVPPPNHSGLFATPPTFSTSPRALPPKVVDDPSMFLSSPARRFGPPPPISDEEELRATRQPYHQQAEESRREELRKSSQQPKRQDQQEEDDLGQSPMPARPPNRPWTSASVSGGSGIRKSPSKGSRSSPGGTSRRRLSSPVSSSLSNSLVLTIGRDGRAKTEMQVVSEPPMPESTAEERPPSKRSAYSSGSTAGGDLRRRLNADEVGEEDETEIDDDDEENSGDAQHALRQVLEGRRRSAAQIRSSPPLQLEGEASPMTDPPTPGGGRSAPSNGTRCVCRSADNGGHLMIQW